MTDQFTEFYIYLECPGCGLTMEAHMATQVGMHVPQDGDQGICGECRTICIYTVKDGAIGVRLPTDEELDELLKDPRVRSVIKAMKMATEQITSSRGKRPEGADWQVLPCGCKYATVDNEGRPTLAFEPHDIHCETFKYVMGKFGDTDNPIEFRLVDE